jgi:hypothetical protein
MKKMRLRRLRTESTWPGAMDFQITTPDGRLHWLSVDSYTKLWWYVARLYLDPTYPCGADYG